MGDASSASTVHLESNAVDILNELPNTDCLTAGDFKEKDFWSAQCMQCTSRFTTKNFNDSREFVKLKRSLKLSRFTVYYVLVCATCSG